MNKRGKVLVLVLVLLVSILMGDKILADTTSVTITVTTAECADTLDNDSDTLVDYPADPGCTSAIDNDETDLVVTFQCNDGIDNDSDSKTDYPTDLGCDSSTDDNESGEIVVVNGGGNGPIIMSPVRPVTGTVVIFAGYAPPGSRVSALADGVLVGSIGVGSDGDFKLIISEVPPGTYIFNLYATLSLGRVTRPLSYAVNIAKSTITEISGIKFDLLEKFREEVCPVKGDLNDDCRVNLLDFSITAYWWDRTLDASFSKLESGELNGDGQVSLEDFSILAYHWTG